MGKYFPDPLLPMSPGISLGTPGSLIIQQPEGFVWPSRSLCILAGRHHYPAWISCASGTRDARRAGEWALEGLVAQKMPLPSLASVSPSVKWGGGAIWTRSFLWQCVILRLHPSATTSFSESPGFGRSVYLFLPLKSEFQVSRPNSVMAVTLELMEEGPESMAEDRNRT